MKEKVEWTRRHSWHRRRVHEVWCWESWMRQIKWTTSRKTEDKNVHTAGSYKKTALSSHCLQQTLREVLIFILPSRSNRLRSLSSCFSFETNALFRGNPVDSVGVKKPRSWRSLTAVSTEEDGIAGPETWLRWDHEIGIKFARVWNESRLAIGEGIIEEKEDDDPAGGKDGDGEGETVRSEWGYACVGVVGVEVKALLRISESPDKSTLFISEGVLRCISEDAY